MTSLAMEMSLKGEGSRHSPVTPPRYFHFLNTVAMHVAVMISKAMEKVLKGEVPVRLAYACDNIKIITIVVSCVHEFWKDDPPMTMEMPLKGRGPVRPLPACRHYGSFITQALIIVNSCGHVCCSDDPPMAMEMPLKGGGSVRPGMCLWHYLGMKSATPLCLNFFFLLCIPNLGEFVAQNLIFRRFLKPDQVVVGQA